MRVLVVIALAALVGCCSPPPRPPIHIAARAHKIVAGMKKRPRHHKRVGGNAKPEVNATRAKRSSDVEAAAKRIRAIIAAKLGNPAAIEIQDIAAGKAADSFCGVAQVKGASGEEREMPFVVHGNVAYIIDGSDDRRAAAAIHDLCD
jgi:hypothetical protein